MEGICASVRFPLSQKRVVRPIPILKGHVVILEYVPIGWDVWELAHNLNTNPLCACGFLYSFASTFTPDCIIITYFHKFWIVYHNFSLAYSPPLGYYVYHPLEPTMSCDNKQRILYFLLSRKLWKSEERKYFLL